MEGKSGLKALSNRMKSKGLQKLMHYCEMCQKQCRDDNGFKCHCMSEGHLRQMQIFGENPNKFIEKFSQEFEDAFLELMKRSHRFSRVAATVVYNEYISDRKHVHMNSTKWLTLTEFVTHLGRTGKCRVENTEKGLFLTYHGRDSESLFYERRKNKRLKSVLVEEVKQENEIAKQIERAAASVGVPMEIEVRTLLGSEPEIGKNKNKKISFALGFGSSSATATSLKPREDSSKSFGVEDVQNVDLCLSKKKTIGDFGGGGGCVRERSSVLDDLMREEEDAKERKNRKSYWLCEEIVVKVTSKAWAEKGCYNKKGVVRKVVDKYIGEIEMLERKDLIQIHQDDLQTVLPGIGGLIRIVNGSYRGFNARLLAIDTHNFCAKVQLEKCVYEGRVLPKVAYEDICKLE
ncbi:KIN17-like protein [Spinacia oleracea]|uniref:KIN17-like protein n=1 Tax=Spinacia oleracea TaxID=3562 RepID=A0A9R0JWK8_SPIOL|nr:KIN17-like protein [Spinacia oleracea]